MKLTQPRDWLKLHTLTLGLDGGTLLPSAAPPVAVRYEDNLRVQLVGTQWRRKFSALKIIDPCSSNP
jgi:hypothetical protein